MDLGKEEIDFEWKTTVVGGLGGERGRGLETTYQKLPGPGE